MKISLCAALSEDKLIAENTRRIAEAAREASMGGSELILFGEAFLHGLEAMVFDYALDIRHALSENAVEIARIRQIAKDSNIAVGFGFFENDKGAIHSSYLIVGSDARIVDKYQRVSSGWKLPHACADYREGKSFHSFRYRDKVFASMICGDFWEDHLLADICRLDADVDAFFWPVHCDYLAEDWQRHDKFSYAERTTILAKPVLFVNNYRTPPNAAKGGAFLWKQGKTLGELPYGQKGILSVEI